MAFEPTTPTATAGPSKKVTKPSRAVSSVAWLVSETLVARVVAFGSQLLLAYLLVREDFGLFAMTNMVRAVAELIASPGLRTLLIQRHAEYDKLAAPVFWLSALLGLLGAASVCVVTYFWYQGEENALAARMIYVVALSIPLRAVCVLPESALRIRMQFAQIAMLGALNVVLTCVISITLAYYGFGAMSLVIPFPIVALIQLAITWWLVRPQIGRRFSIDDCWGILHSSLVLFASRVLTVLSANIDYFFLLMFHDKVVVGLYFLAFNISTQTLRLFSESLVQVLMPSLVHIPEQERRLATTVRATRAISLVVMPSCFLLGLIAKEFVEIGYRPEYIDMVPILVVLCLGMAFRCVGAISNALLNAQGRFGTVLTFDVLTTAIFSASVGVAAWLGSAVSVAFVVSANVIIRMLFLQRAALTYNGVTYFRAGVISYLLPVAVAFVAYLAGVSSVQWLQANVVVSPWRAAAIKIASFSVTYLLLAFWLMKDDVLALISRIASLWPRIFMGPDRKLADGSTPQ